MIASVIAAMVGTIAFSVIYSVPRKYYGCCAAVGGFGWLAYLLTDKAAPAAWACLVATMLIMFLSRAMAVWKKSPVSMFLIPGIFSLVPGAGIYWTSFYIVTDQAGLALTTGYEAVKSAVAIVLGIVFVSEIPQVFFRNLVAFLERLNPFKKKEE